MKSFLDWSRPIASAYKPSMCKSKPFSVRFRKSKISVLTFQ